MSRKNQLNVRMTPQEHGMLEALAAKEERTMSDTFRRILRKEFEASGMKLPKKPAKS